MLKFKKRVTLEFLGDEYKDSYIDLESLPIDKLQDLLAEAKTKNDSEDQGEALSYMRKVVEDNFITGSVSQNGKMVDVTLEDVPSLPVEVFIEAFQQIVGKIPNA